MHIQQLLEMSNRELFSAEQQIDRLFRDIGLDVKFSRHAMNRMLDPDDPARRDYDANQYARDTDVTQEELVAAFKEMKQKYGSQLLKARSNPEAFVGVLKDVATKLNLPFVIDYDIVRKRVHDLVVKTVMRKDNFKTDHSVGRDFPVNSGITPKVASNANDHA